MTIFGYARGSTNGRSVDTQVKALRAAGAVKVFRETTSGAKTDRRELAKTLMALDAGDTFLVTRLDRLARSTRDLLNIPHGEAPCPHAPPARGSTRSACQRHGIASKLGAPVQRVAECDFEPWRIGQDIHN
jgi:hypothetical protein